MFESVVPMMDNVMQFHTIYEKLMKGIVANCIVSIIVKIF